MKIIGTREQLSDVANDLDSSSVVGLDLETTSLSPHDGKIRLCTLNTGRERYVIDLFKTNGLGPVRDALASDKCVKIGQNLKFDQRFLMHEENLELWPVFDTFRASNLIHNGRNMDHDLWSIFARELQVRPTTRDLGGSDWSGELSEEQLEYATEDVEYLPALREKMKPQLAALGLNRVALIEFGAIAPEARMELNGFKLDSQKWLALAEQSAKKAEALKEELLAELPSPTDQICLPGMVASWNLNSSAQILKSLKRLGVKVESTNENVLAMQAAKYPLVKKIIQYRKLFKLSTTYGLEYLRHVNKNTGRIHTNFYPFTGAGRYACVASWTPVRTSEGSKQMRDVCVGDLVWTHRNRWRRVLKHWIVGTRPVYRVRFSNGHTLTCSDTHRLLDSDGNWIETRHIYEAQNYSFYAGEGRALVEVEEICPCGSLQVYDITVEEDSSYETLGVFSHNSSSPNLQQIPRGAVYRACFSPGPGKAIIVADYSQVELRLVAQISGDKTFLKVYRRAEDAHSQTAALLNAIAVGDVTKAMRQAAKPVNFGFIYGMGAEKLVIYAQSNYGVSLSIGQAKKFRNRFFESYSGVSDWHRYVVNEVKPTGITRTLAGRLRYLESERAHSEYFNCLDEETEALTKRGWVRGMDLDMEDEILTKDPRTGRLEWHKPLDLKKWPEYEGPLVEFRSRSFNAVSTPGHRWLVRNKSTGKDECKTTSELSVWGDHRIHRTGVYEGGEALHSDDFVRLCGWFLTDGSFAMTGTNNTRPTVTLCQSERANPEKVSSIDGILDRLKILTGRYVTKSTGMVQWRLTKSASEFLHSLFPARVITPEFASGLVQDQRNILLDTMMSGDGHIDAGGKQVFCAGSKRRADAFQMLCTLCGVATNAIARDMSKYSPKSPKRINVPKAGIVYYVTMLRRNTAQVVKRQRKEFYSKQPVWCPIVPNTFFVARREGQVFITGNTPVQGCIPASVRVLTSSGYEEIGSIPNSGVVWTGVSWETYEKIPKGVWKRAEVEFENGQVLQCDTRHKVLCEGDHGYEFIDFENLLGKRACFSMARPIEFGSSAVDRDAYWLGFSIGNGSSDRNYLTQTFGDRKGRYTKEQKAEEWKLFCSSLGFETQAPRTSDNKISITVENKRFRERWESFGYDWSWRSHTKRIPRSIWTGSLVSRSMFILGLLDADGTVGDRGKTTPSIHLCQRELLAEVQVLARTVGVESTLRGPYGDVGSWRLDLNGGQLAGLGYVRRSRSIVPSVRAPRFLIENALVVRGNRRSKNPSYKTLWSRLSRGGHTSCYTLRSMLAEFGESLEMYSASKIVRVSPLEESEMTYTLSVDSPLHRFDSEGVISKNSGADGLKRALRIVHERLKKYGDAAKMVHMVHDEIVLEVDDDPELTTLVAKELEEGMIEGIAPFLTAVPVVCDAAVGPSWADKA